MIKTPDEIMESMMRDMQFHNIPPEVVTQEAIVFLVSCLGAMTEDFTKAAGFKSEVDMGLYEIEIIVNRKEKTIE